MIDWTTRPTEADGDAHYLRYLEPLPADGDLLGILERQRSAWLRLATLPSKAQTTPYATGKWNLRQLAGHLADTERVFRGRLLRLVREDGEGLRGYDENVWAAVAGWENGSLFRALHAFDRERAALLDDLAELSDEALSRAGTVEGRRLSGRLVPWILAGHAAHHLRVARERYLEPAGLDPWKPREIDAGDGLRLEEARPEWAGRLFALIDSDRAHLGAWLAWVETTRREADTAAFLRRVEREHALGTSFVFGLVEEGRLLGLVGLHGVFGAAGEIGYWLHAEAEGRGRMLRAVRALVAWAERGLELKRIVIRCEPENLRSLAIPRRLGFIQEGRLRAGSPEHPGRDILVHSRLADRDPPL